MMEGEQKESACDLHETIENEDDEVSLNQGDHMTQSLFKDPPVASECNGFQQNDLNINLYREDVVRHKKIDVIGIVSEVAGDSDSDSSITEDEASDDDDDDDGDEDEDEVGNTNGDNNTHASGDKNRQEHTYKDGSLQAGQIRVVWMDDTEPTQDIRDITLVDRGFYYGDYVSSASNPTGQIGIVVDVNIFADLLSFGGTTVKNVSSRNLKRVRDFAVGDHVVLGPWLGRVDDVLDNVTILFEDGSQCKVTKAEPTRLIPVIKTNFEDDGHFPYYPGQRVRASSSSVFKNARWLSGLWKANRLEGTVTKVTVGSVFISWISSACYGSNSSTSPAEEQSPKNLKLLSCLSHANWQVGDWCLHSQSNLDVKDSAKSELNSSQPESGGDSEELTPDDLAGTGECMDVDVSKDIPENLSLDTSSCASDSTAPHHRKKIRKVVVKKDRKSRKQKEMFFEKALAIVSTTTKVDVAWQDGTIERGRDSITLIPNDNLGDHEFLAEQYVIEKASDEDEDTGEARSVGVLKSVNSEEKTACVRWLKPVARAEDLREFGKEEIVSVYELEGHPDYDYCYGDVVVRLSQVAASVVDSVEESEDAEKCSGNKKVHNLPDDFSMDFSDLSWVGNITGLRNGDIEVTWADGMVSTVGPQAICVVDRDDEDESIAAGSEVSDAVSWETVDDDDMDILENTREELGTENSSNVNSKGERTVQNNYGRNVPYSLPVASAIGLVHKVSRLASGFFSWGKKNEHDASLVSIDENKEGMTSRSGFEESSSQASNVKEEQDTKIGELTNAEEAMSPSKTGEISSPACDEDESLSFKRFDIAKDPLDHHFLSSSEQVNNNRKWLKKVQKDWNILQNNLPDGIYARVYEDRMDLARAVIVGAYGTPYQDGIFFFDFYLSPDYPDVAPSVYYHSGGWRINPNLYEEGKVCLSLLNTWTGKGNEVWDPTSSTILQILVSLQGLVLNAKPYFNEAGYDRQIDTLEGEKNSLSYNENAFLLSCKTMMYLMRRPPKDFEGLVKDHFKRRGYYILKACDAYMKGYLIGALTEDASVSKDDNGSNSTSVGFRLGLKKIVPKLYTALTDAGADCHDFSYLQHIA